MFGILRRIRPAPAIETDQDLMLRFCSLGYNCEFGMAQRAYDAEPLDLLRWAATPFPVLLALLHRQFAGIGDPAALRIDTASPDPMVNHTGYDFCWHSFAGPQMTATEVHAREVKRLPFLARKLIEDIGSAGRFFVITRASVAEAREVLGEMDRFGGRPVLLSVSDGAPVGVERIAPRLLHGRIPAFADWKHVDKTTRAEDWLALCRLVAVLH